MNIRTPIILAALCAICGLFITFFESRWESSSDKESKSQRVFEVKSADIEKMYVRQAQGVMELQKKGKDWEITTPIKYPADAQVVNETLMNIEYLSRSRSFEMKDINKELEQYGLKSPKMVLRCNWKKEQIELRVGRETAVGGGVYVQVQKGSRSVLVIRKDLVDQFSRPVDQWRDKSPMRFERKKLLSLTLQKSVGKEIELKKTADAHWVIAKPLSARADDSVVEGLIGALQMTQVKKFVSDDSSNLNDYGLREPLFTISITLDGAEKPMQLHLGQSNPKDPEVLYAKNAASPTVFTLPADFIKKFSLPVVDLRNRKIMTWSPAQVSRIAMKRGNGSWEVSRNKDGVWIASQEKFEIQQNAVHSFLAEVGKAEVVEYVSDAVSDLKKYGLDEPSLRLTVASRVMPKKKEDAADTPAPDEFTLAVGKQAKGGYYARNEQDSSVISIGEDLYKHLQITLSDWRDPSVIKSLPEKINQIEVTDVRGKKSVTLSRGSDSAWSCQQGKVNPLAVQSLCATLAGLKAEKWLPSDTKAPDKKKMIASIKWGGEAPVELTLWDLADGSRSAVAQVYTLPGDYFQIHSGDVALLMQPILQK